MTSWELGFWNLVLSPFEKLTTLGAYFRLKVLYMGCCSRRLEVGIILVVFVTGMGLMPEPAALEFSR